MIIMKISSSPTSWRIAKSSLKFAQKIIAECNDNGKLRVAEFKKGKKSFRACKRDFLFHKYWETCSEETKFVELNSINAFFARPPETDELLLLEGRA